jgi:hypothetical protein
MVGFGSNWRSNTLQLANLVTLLACGVSERVNNYLSWIGLSLSKKTAQKALESLGRHAKKNYCEDQSRDSYEATHLYRQH